MKEVGYCYFLEAVGLNRFKIGHAKILPNRFDQLDTASPCDLKVFGVIRDVDYIQIENKLHRLLEQRRIRRTNGSKRWKEWFKLNRAEATKILHKYNGISEAYENESDEFDSNLEFVEIHERVVTHESLGVSIKNYISDFVLKRTEALEKLSVGLAGFLALFLLSASQFPLEMPMSVDNSPKMTLTLPKLMTDYHNGLFTIFLQDADNSDFITQTEYRDYWYLLWDDIKERQNKYADSVRVPKFLDKVKSFSFRDSLDYVLHNYIWENWFVEPYSDSVFYAEGLDYFTHKLSDCPLKDVKPFRINGELFGGHNDCLGEIEDRKKDADASAWRLRKARKKYSGLTL